MNHFIDAFKKYAVFDGRTSRKGYWMFILFHIIALIILSILDSIFKLELRDGRGILQFAYSLVVVIPSIAIGVRRLHDSERNGWWVILPIVNLIMFMLKGSTGPNKYGPVPSDPNVTTPAPTQTTV